MGVNFKICECHQKDCCLRFPVTELDPGGENCPRCGATTTLVATPHPEPIANQDTKFQGLKLEGFLDNLRSVHNVGSIFRTADGAGIRHLYLGGITPTPEHPRLAKAALGAERTVPWTRHNNGVAAVKKLKKQGCHLWALENNAGAESLFSIGPIALKTPLVLVVGNELCGVDPGILELCEKIVYLPMQGTKNSLNVAVAFGVAVYFLRSRFNGSCS